MLDFPGDRPPRQILESTLREFLHARGSGDVSSIVARLSPRFVYRTSGTWPTWPYSAGPIGRQAFAEATSRLHAEYENLGSEIHEFLVDGDAAAAHVTCVTRSRGAGEPVRLDVWLFLRVCDALVDHIAMYADLAAARALAPGGVVEVRPAWLDEPPQTGARPPGKRLPAAPEASAAAGPVEAFFARRERGDMPGMAAFSLRISSIVRAGAGPRSR